MRYVTAFTALAFLLIACKKKEVHPAFEDRSINMAYPRRIDIDVAPEGYKSSLYVEYTEDKQVRSVKREVNVANPVLDSTMEQYFTYEGGLVKTVTTNWRYQPEGVKRNVYTEESFVYQGASLTNYRIITKLSGGAAPEVLDTATTAFQTVSENYTTYLSKEGGGFSISGNPIGRDNNTYTDSKTFELTVTQDKLDVEKQSWHKQRSINKNNITSNFYLNAFESYTKDSISYE
ncbi:MAG TPA: hypothetical protein VL947_05250, partial [Cytophagales bacterium]|nr:hypothetical protein [Cytophagales bacterium]